jgi:hypothetical protein
MLPGNIRNRPQHRLRSARIDYKTGSAFPMMVQKITEHINRGSLFSEGTVVRANRTPVPESL